MSVRVSDQSRVRPVMTLSGFLGGSVESGPSGQVPTANGSNQVAWGSNVAIITSNGSNALLGPYVNFASGSNIIFTLDQGPFPQQSIPSNTLRIHSTGGLAGGGISGSRAGVNFVIDGGGSTITTGVKGYVEVPFAWSDIDAVRMFADQSGSIVVDIWKDTYGNFPPVDADSITAAAPPTISGTNKSQDTTLTGWTQTGSAGDILGFNVDSATTVTRVTVSLTLVRS